MFNPYNVPSTSNDSSFFFPEYLALRNSLVDDSLVDSVSQETAVGPSFQRTDQSERIRESEEHEHQGLEDQCYQALLLFAANEKSKPSNMNPLPQSEHLFC